VLEVRNIQPSGLGRSQNYVSRMLRGDLVGLTFDAAFEMLRAAGMSPADFLRSLADALEQTERAAAEADQGAREQGRRAKATAQFLDLIDRAALKAAIQPIIEELAEEVLARQRKES